MSQKNRKSNIMKRKLKDRLFFAVLVVLSSLLALPLVLIFSYIFKHGIAAISWDFFTQVPVPVGELGGGILNALWGSFYILSMACLIAIPWGVCVGVYLFDARETRLTYWIRLSVEILQATPSIVIGIVAYAWVVLPMHSFSGFSGGIALGVMMLPMVIRATEETLKLIPNSIKEASLALGVPYYRTIFRVVLPAGVSGIMTGVLLGLARIAGETAPLLFTAFGSAYLVHNLMNPMGSLPLLIFNYAMSPYDDWHTLAWGASLVLVVFILLVNILVKVVTSRWNVKF